MKRAILALAVVTSIGGAVAVAAELRPFWWAARDRGLAGLREAIERYEPPWTPPSVAWEAVDPERVALSDAALEGLRERWAALRTRHLLIVRNDRIAFEWSAPGRSPNRALPISAGAKCALGGSALALAMDDGRVRLDDPASKFIPRWRGDPSRAGIRLRELANHTSGIQNIAYGRHGSLKGWERTFSEDHAQRFPLTLTRAAVLHPPGSRIHYSSVAYYALSYALTRALRGSETPDLRVLLERRLMQPLGIPPEAWEIGYGGAHLEDGQSHYTVASGARLTARAWARIGQLMLREGDFEGRRVLSRESVAALVTPGDLPERREPGVPTPGIGWWLNSDGFLPSLPRDSYFCTGSQHALLLVIPSWDTIVVRLGRSVPIGREQRGANRHARFWDGVDDVLLAPLAAVLAPPSDG